MALFSLAFLSALGFLLRKRWRTRALVVTLVVLAAVAVSYAVALAGQTGGGFLSTSPIARAMTDEAARTAPCSAQQPSPVAFCSRPPPLGRTRAAEHVSRGAARTLDRVRHRARGCCGRHCRHRPSQQPGYESVVVHRRRVRAARRRLGRRRRPDLASPGSPQEHGVGQRRARPAGCSFCHGRGAVDQVHYFSTVYRWRRSPGYPLRVDRSLPGNWSRGRMDGPRTPARKPGTAVQRRRRKPADAGLDLERSLQHLPPRCPKSFPARSYRDVVTRFDPTNWRLVLDLGCGPTRTRRTSSRPIFDSTPSRPPSASGDPMQLGSLRHLLHAFRRIR